MKPNRISASLLLGFTLAVLFLGPAVLSSAADRPQDQQETRAQPTTGPSDAPANSAPESLKTPANPDTAQHDEEFKNLVTNARLSGHFTMDGGGDEDGHGLGELQRDEYVITGAMKVGQGDFWLLTSQIKYGDVDLTVPVPVQVKWAGNTPVITVEKVGIPGLGTFSARVLLDGARYAGTWSHDEKGGHLFGVIEPSK